MNCFYNVVVVVLLLFFILISSARCDDQTDGYDFPTPANLRGNEARGPHKYSYVLNLVVPLNGTLSVSTLNQSKAIYWALTRYTNDSTGQNENTLQIYNILNPDIRTRRIRETFECLPNDTDCKQIVVRRFNVSMVGVYSYQSSFINTLDSLFVQYNVSTFIRSLSIECSPNQSCVYNETTGLLSVVQGSSVTLTCTTYIAQNDVFEPSVELRIKDDYEECAGGETQVRRIPADSMISNTSMESVNLILYRISRKCTRTFSKTNRNYKCELIPKVQAVPMELQPTDSYDTAKLRLDVQYPAENTATNAHLFNRSIIVNTSVAATFSCPFDGNPTPQYEWRVASAQSNKTEAQRRRLDPTQFLSSSREYTIPKDLEVGLYAFECRARTLGLIDKYSDVVKFYLNVMPSPVTAKKAILLADKHNSFLQNSQTNVGAIVGGIVGGLAALIIIVLVVLFFVRRHFRNSKDEIEKAKELDIDINDNNPHLSSRSNLSTAGLTQSTQPQQQQVKSNGIGHKAIAGLMVPSSTAQSYAAIAHAAAAAAQSNQQRNNQYLTSNGSTTDAGNAFSSSSSNNMLFQSNAANANNANKQQSYNNPGFFESTPYSIQNPLESPPPYDAALHQPIKKDSPLQQQRILMQQQQQQQQQQQHQQKDFMGSNSRLLSGTTTPTLQHKSGGVPTSQSYTASPQANLLMNSTPTANSLQQIQYQQQQPNSAAALQYTTVQNLARNRNPLSGLQQNDMDTQQQQQTSIPSTQYTTMSQLNPIDV